MREITRREAIRLGAGSALALGAPRLLGGCGGSTIGPADAGSTAPAVVHAILGDQLSELTAMTAQATRALGITRNALLGARVFIKPNFVGLGIFEGFSAAVGECTKPEIVAAVAEQCLEAGAARVTIGDGAQGISWSWDTVTFLPGNTFKGVGNLAAAVAWLNQKYGDRVELACLNQVDQWERIPSCSPDPLLADGLLVSRPFYEADHVISVPTLKSHQWAELTVSLKNFVGVTPLTRYRLIGEPSRGALHAAYAEATCGGVDKAGIGGCYLDIFKWRRETGRQDFAIVDCSIGLEKNGPHAWQESIPIELPGSGGKTIDFKARSRVGKYFLLAGQDLVAADAVAAQVAAYEADSVKQLVMARNLGLGETRNISVRGASVWDLTVPDWLRADHLEEWGLPATAQASTGREALRHGPSLNTLFALACPTAAVCLFKWLHRRKSVRGLPTGE